MILFLLRIVYCCSLGVFSASTNLHSQNISAPISIRLKNVSDIKEVSAMAWKGPDTLFIIQQRDTGSFTYALREEIEVAKNQNAELKLHSLGVKGLGDFQNSLGTYFKKINGMNERIFTYDGIEACVINGNNFFISIEGTQRHCYVLKGFFDGHTIQFDNQRFYTLNKPARIGRHGDNNDGFETLYQINDSTIQALFELDTTGSLVYTLSTGMNKFDTTDKVLYNYRIERRPKQRIAEVCRYNDTTFYGIDFLYREQHGQPCYSMIVKLHFFNNKIEIDTVTSLSYRGKNTIDANCINFEAMAPFRNGLLLASDNNPSDNQCTLLYYYEFQKR